VRFATRSTNSWQTITVDGGDAVGKLAMRRDASRRDRNPDLDLTTLQPGLFSICKQTRAEGLAIFYQHHYFRFNVGLNLPYTNVSATFQIINASDEASHALACKRGYGAILDWLERIGDLGRENIRNLKLLGHFDLADWQHMSRIHSQLSDKATVIYRPFDPSDADGL